MTTVSLIERIGPMAGARGPALPRLLVGDASLSAASANGWATPGGGLTQPVHRAALIQTALALTGRGGTSSSLAAAAALRSSAPLGAMPMDAASGALSGDGVILVAEDHPTNQQVVLRQLRRLGFQAELAEDGVEALAAWRRGAFRLLITDCHMPRMDGYELARSIRAAEAAVGGGRRLPIVAMTANALSGEMERCVAAGMDDYLAKPVTLTQLASALNRWLVAAPPPAEPAVTEPPAVEPPPVPPIPPDVLVLDLDHLRETFGSLDGGTLDMMDYFLETTRPTLDQALAALASGQMEDARAAAHSVAGAARTAGAKRLAIHCTAMERAVIEERLSDARTHAAAMAQAFPEVEDAIHALRQPAAPTP